MTGREPFLGGGDVPKRSGDEPGLGGEERFEYLREAFYQALQARIADNDQIVRIGNLLGELPNDEVVELVHEVARVELKSANINNDHLRRYAILAICKTTTNAEVQLAGIEEMKKHGGFVVGGRWSLSVEMCVDGALRVVKWGNVPVEARVARAAMQAIAEGMFVYFGGREPEERDPYALNRVYFNSFRKLAVMDQSEETQMWAGQYLQKMDNFDR